MEDRTRMIDAARRRARRMARRTDLTYQQALDQVARDAGRDHWSAFMADPLPVARDGPQETRAVEPHQDDGVATLRAEWDLPAERRLREHHGFGFIPGWNVLGPDWMPPAGEPRDTYLGRVAAVLVPHNGRNDYFDQRGRQAMHAFLSLETFRAEAAVRNASIPAMIDWINDGLREAGERRRRESGRDPLTEWLAGLSTTADATTGGGRAAATMAEIAIMSPNERSGVLGTMDRGLLPFRAPGVRGLNS